MMRRVELWRRAWRIALLLCLVACGTSDTGGAGDPPDLVFADAGTPEQVVVRQVFANEADPGPGPSGLQLAYGDHPDVSADDNRVVVNAFNDPMVAEVLVVFSDHVEGLSMGEGEDAMAPSGAVALVCDGVPADISGTRSVYSPYGGQSLDPEVGPRSLGPVVAIYPNGLKMGTTCVVEFGEQVVGLDGSRVCAPADGEDCIPGDTSGIEIGVWPLGLLGNTPIDGATDVPVSSQILLQFNYDIESDSIGDIELSDEVGVVPATLEVQTINPSIVDVMASLAPDTAYTLRVPAGDPGPREIRGGQLEEEIVITFGTAP